MRRAVVIAGLAVGAFATCAGVAAGQGGGAAVGPSAQGTYSFRVVVPFGDAHRHGVNRAVPGKKGRQRVGDVIASNFDLYEGDRKVGTGHEVDVVTYVPHRKKYRGGLVALQSIVLAFEGAPGANEVNMQCITVDSPTDSPCAIVGGTGRFAGARGYETAAVLEGKENRKQRTFSFDAQLVFIP